MGGSERNARQIWDERIVGEVGGEKKSAYVCVKGVEDKIVMEG